jgi:hypothetical protein
MQADSFARINLILSRVKILKPGFQRGSIYPLLFVTDAEEVKKW